jgi:antirestriction protein ArdC
MTTKKTTPQRSSEPSRRAGVFATVTETLMKMIEDGHPPWRSRWSEVRPRKGRSIKPRLVLIGRLAMPISISSHKPYRGVNVLILWASSLKRGYGSPYWGTLKAWNGVGCRVRKGEQATRIVRWIEQTELDPASGDVVDEEWCPVIHSVFNAGQVEGPDDILAKYGADAPAPRLVPEAEAEPKPEPRSWDWEPAERLVGALRPKIKWGGAEASYNFGSDMISMPDRDRFRTEAGRYSVLLHEVGHWSGHKNRLDRDLTGDQDSPAYWMEELVAELTACFVLANLDLPDRLEELPHSAAYLKRYLDLLQGDRRTLVKSAGLAQRASDYILSGGTAPTGPTGRKREQGRKNRRRQAKKEQPQP